MGKASRKKKIGKKYYFVEDGSTTLRTLYTESDEEVYNKALEIVGNENFKIVQLPKKQTIQEIRHLEELSEKLAGELFSSECGYIMKTMHEFNRV